VCFCGAIAAELSGAPVWICFDHDDDCRRAVGAPLNVWVGYRAHQVRFTRGAPRSFSRTAGVVRTFCADCGTSIGYRDQGLGDEVYLTIGFLDRPERFCPQAHAYWGMRLPWLEMADRLHRIEGYSRPRSDDLGDPRDR
jgi:hypothetical protein